MPKPEVNTKRVCKIMLARFESEDGFPQYAPPGATDKDMFGPDFWLVACPGCGFVSAMRIGSPKPEKKPSWELIDENTLMPSVHCTGCCGWHGFLTHGIFKPC